MRRLITGLACTGASVVALTALTLAADLAGCTCCDWLLRPLLYGVVGGWTLLTLLNVLPEEL